MAYIEEKNSYDLCVGGFEHH
jgi:hypothetical protein